MNDATAPATPPRSSFITVVAWIFICLGAALSLLAVLEVVVFSVLPIKNVQEMMNAGQGSMPMPGYTKLMFAHLGLYLAVFFIGSVALFVTSIGLLKRKRWARPTMAILLGIGVIKDLVSAALAAEYYLSNPMSMMPMPANMPQDADAMFNSMMAASILFSIGFSLVVAGLLAWVVVRLLSARIKAEFEPLAPPATPEATDAPA